MIELTNNEKKILKDGRQYLEDGDIKNFYEDYMVFKAECSEVAHINRWFMEKGVNLMPMCLKIQEIPDYAYYGTDIESIEIPEGIKFVGEQAFSSCGKLKKVVLPSTIEHICWEAFRDGPEPSRPSLQIDCYFDNIDESTWPDWESYVNSINVIRK